MLLNIVMATQSAVNLFVIYVISFETDESIGRVFNIKLPNLKIK